LSDDRVSDFETARERRERRDRPRIEVRTGELARLVREAEQALLRTSAGIYQRAGQLVRIARVEQEATYHGVRRKAGSIVIMPVTKEYLTLALARSARWERHDGRARGFRPIEPPAPLAASLLAMVGEWRLPVLTGLVTAPTLRADGTLLDSPGYDAASGLYCAFEREEFSRTRGVFSD
jgi:hypothetical protein